ncbi:PLP-dependent aminotransferase family protein [Nocardioides mangrovicus]|uniref:PLP-dependent aminotransferase family protein n=1 Tax=Nocardioides mangrovicus TaxID=2478913 RepID=A0A3L8P6Y6_9ACTN|nr:PLP-dependent aminotransferase family protein [Nocardioides mangrovicus]RLV51116.1 PLP-dependent aminotransferase family protein [Nocardioides mangrovicus]
MSRVIAARSVARLLDDFDRSPAYKGLAEALRVLITDGRLPLGARLPSERELTAALDVSRTTVARAYAELRDHGYLVSRQGSGSVAALPDSAGHRTDHLLTPSDTRADTIDLTCAAPLPGPGLLAAYERATAALPPYLAGTGYHPSGLPVLREAVAATYDARGLPTSPDQVLVVPGALAGVAVAVQALVSPGDRVVLESPTYPNAIAALGHAGARLAGVGVHRDEDAADLVTAIRQVAPRAAYLIPDFHNPTARLMGDADRERVARALRRTRTTAVVDESMVALGLDDEPLPAPFATYSPGSVSVGSVSKAFWGGIRIGWVRAPEHLVDTLFRARLALDLGSSPLEQLVAADLLTHGADLLEHRRRQLRASRDAARAAIVRHLPQWRVGLPGGGLSLWCELPAALSSALVPVAARHGVLLAAGPAFAPEGGLDRFVRLPFALPADVLVDAVERIAAAWQETQSSPGSIGRGPRTPMVA